MTEVKLNPHISTSLSPGHFLLALAGLIITLCIFAAKYTSIEIAMRSALRDKVSSQIQRGNTRSEVREALHWLAHPSALTAELNGIDVDVSENRLYRSEILLNAIEKLQIGEVRRAYNLSEDQLPATLKQLYRTYFEKEEQLQSARKSAVELSREIPRLEKEFELIAQDISDLFASKPLIRQNDETLLRYETGVLKSMPVIKGVPDGLSELEDLKPHIQLILGNMDNDKTASFRENFERLRQASQQNESEIVSFRTSLDTKNQEALKLDAELAGILKKISALSASEITGE